MLELSHHDIEWLEAISQDEDARALFLRMAALSQEGRLEPFLTALARDDELDEQTKGTVAELAGDTAFLLAVAEYLRADRRSSTRRAYSGAPAGETSRFPRTPSTCPLRSAASLYAMGDRGFEPRTSALSERRSNQLS